MFNYNCVGYLIFLEEENVWFLKEEEKRVEDFLFWGSKMLVSEGEGKEGTSEKGTYVQEGEKSYSEVHDHMHCHKQTERESNHLPPASP